MYILALSLALANGNCFFQHTQETRKLFKSFVILVEFSWTFLFSFAILFCFPCSAPSCFFIVFWINLSIKNSNKHKTENLHHFFFCFSIQHFGIKFLCNYFCEQTKPTDQTVCVCVSVCRCPEKLKVLSEGKFDFRLCNLRNLHW